MAVLPPARPGSENGGPEGRDEDPGNLGEPSETPSEEEIRKGRKEGPYARAWREYLEGGWNPLPVVGKAGNLPVGYTGETGKSVTAVVAAQWAATRGVDNLGVRLPVGVVGIDVDDYDGKGGWETLLALIKVNGPLPATWSTSARDGRSRQLLYRTPPHLGVRLPGVLGPGVEVIQHHHRYTVCWPSVHPGNRPDDPVRGKVYTWYAPDGTVSDRPPRVEELAELPEAWHSVAPLGAAKPAGGGGSAGYTNPDVDSLLLNGIPVGVNQDEALRDLVWKLVAGGASDAQVELQWLAVVSRTPLTRVDEPWTADDFQRHLRGARQKLGGGVGRAERAWAAGVGVPRKPEESEKRKEKWSPPAPAAGAEPIPGPGSPLKVAQLLKNEWADSVTGLPTRWHWRGGWLAWTGTHWQEEQPGLLQDWLYHRLENAVWKKPSEKEGGEAKPVAWNPSRRTTTEVERALEAVRRLPAEVEAGSRWSAEDLDWVAEDVHGVACRNGVVDPVSRELRAHSPAWLNLSSLPFDYDERARCPRWLAFLEEVLPGDAAAQALLQEWFGYVVSGRTSLQKMMFFVGASRSGKSTTARVLTSLLGARNVAAPTLSSFGSNFGLSSLIGKPLAVIDDARYSRSVDLQVVIERLLSITGEGQLDVDRKNRAVWTGKLPTRVVMSSNELPWFRDASGAIINRMLVVEFGQSFLGREDPLLEKALELELPGILNWALAGLDRLRLVAGSFTVPASAAEAVDELRGQASPIQVFVSECCELDPGAVTAVDELFIAWLVWKGDVKDDRSARTAFGIAMRAAMPKLKRVRRTVADGSKPYFYEGVRLVHRLPQWAQRPLDGA